MKNENELAKQESSKVVRTSDMFTDPELMERMVRFSEIMASGKSTVPAHLAGNAGDCMAITLQAAQWGMNPFAVAQKTHVIKGVLGYEAQLVNAVITSMAPTKDRLNFEWFGDWSKVVGKFLIRKGDKGEYRIPGWALADEEGLGVKVWATIKGEKEPRVLEVLLAQARTRNSTLWADDPKQQLAYLGIKKWGRLHTPDAIMGVYTPDELAGDDDIVNVDMGDAEVVADEKTKPEAELMPDYPQDLFDKNFDKWVVYIESGKKTADEIISTVQTKGTLSDEMVSMIKGINAPEVAE